MVNDKIEYINVSDVYTKSSKKSKIQRNFKINLNMNLYKLIGLNFIIYFITLMFPQVFNLLVLDTRNWVTHPWTILTSFFLHSLTDPGHIMFNMFALFIFGSMLQYILGPKHFIRFYIVSGIIVNFLSTFFYNGLLLGASGAIMAVAGMLIVLKPNIKLYLYFFIPIRLWQLGILYLVLNFFQIFIPSNVANFAHIIGLFIGMGYGLYYKKRLMHRLQNLNFRF